ncbi:MAG: hypothetical protein BWY36_00910 [Candidatus Diapherotrites archaeon ADurb.Bin253]|nr:MAG: hypothetical protein BWY36_00910 [Candidatus Diapherotrites archaeon ADurb.Bin253]
MAQVDKKAIFAQIQKLLALGTSPNENEAKLATAKANALLLKYNLSIDDVEDVKMGSGITQRKHAIDGKRVAHWKSGLMNVVCESNYCRVLISTEYNGSKNFIIIGKKVNINITEQMYVYLYETIERLSKNYGRGVTEKNSYRLGMVQGIYEVLKAQKQQQEKNGIEECTALMVVNFEKENNNAIQKYINEEIGRVRKTTQKNNINGNAYGEGVRDGRNVNLNKQIRA